MKFVLEGDDEEILKVCPSGIYAIYRKGDSKIYIGQSQNLKKRHSDHSSNLRCGRHGNPQLQRAWNKHGEDAFEFCVVEFVPNPDHLNDAEQWYMDRYGAAKGHGYNILPSAGSPRGEKWAPDRRAAHSALRKRNFEDPAVRAANAERNRKRWEDPALREAASKGQLKRFEDPEQCAAFAERSRQFRANHPEAGPANGERLKKLYANNPEMCRAAARKQRMVHNRKLLRYDKTGFSDEDQLAA